MYTRVGLVRALVLGEADVAVDAEYRAAGQPGICNHVRAYLTQDFAEVHHEVDQRVPDVALVPRLVVLKPLAVVVVGELGQELEQGRVKWGDAVIRFSPFYLSCTDPSKPIGVFSTFGFSGCDSAASFSSMPSPGPSGTVR